MGFDGTVLDELETTETPTRRTTGRGLRGGRVLARWVAAALAFVLVIGLAGLPLYVLPRTDRPEKADAVVVLGPSSAPRIALGTRLVREGYASHLYVSEPTDKLAYPPCYSLHTSCFSPSPTTTRGEARFTRQQALAHGWSRVIVITATYHISRARFIFGRCSGVDPIMVSSHEGRSPAGWVYEYAYQTTGFVKAAIVGCADN